MNKKRIFLSAFTGAMIATTFAVMNNSTEIFASGVVHTHGPSYTSMYTRTGEPVSNRALAADTPWQVGEVIQLNSETMYQVSTNEFVKASDVTYEAQPDVSINPVTPEKTDNDQNPNADVSITADVTYNGSPIFDDRTKEVTWEPLGSSFRVARVVQSDTGLVYYQVSPHGWMVGDLVHVSGHIGKVEQVYGFRPIAAFQGETPEEVRELLYEGFGCDWDGLEAVPDDIVIEQWSISNYLGHDIGDLYRRMYGVNPNIGGSMYYHS